MHPSTSTRVRSDASHMSGQVVVGGSVRVQRIISPPLRREDTGMVTHSNREGRDSQDHSDQWRLVAHRVPLQLRSWSVGHTLEDQLPVVLGNMW